MKAKMADFRRICSFILSPEDSTILVDSMGRLNSKIYYIMTQESNLIETIKSLFWIAAAILISLGLAQLR